MMKLGEMAALLRQAAAVMNKLKLLYSGEANSAHRVFCCERMAGTCLEAAQLLAETDNMDLPQMQRQPADV